MKKNIGAITFHSSYNYGSVLQAYALQEFIKKNFGYAYNYQIINLRTERQKRYYDKSFGMFDLKNNLKKILLVGHKVQILKRKNKYEDFINNKLCVTKEYASLEELQSAKLDFDYFISGSDQIWNYKILDFDWSFFLEFVNGNAKKISYAVSFGPRLLDLSDDESSRLKKDLAEYDNISVREAGSAEMVKQILGKSVAKIHVDPTFLLEKEDWNKIIGDRIYNGDYILLYDLKGNKNAYKISRVLSKIYNIPVLIVKENAKLHFLYRDFVRKYDAGPIEFLNYVKYAKVVVSSSFHGNVFSIIFEKPFLAVDGKEDLRISNLLKLTKLVDRAVSDVDDLASIDLFNLDYTVARKSIQVENMRSREYLADALDVEKGAV